MEPVFLSPDYFSEYSDSLAFLLLSVGAAIGFAFGYAAWGYRSRSAKAAVLHSKELQEQVQQMKDRRRELLDQITAPNNG